MFSLGTHKNNNIVFYFDLDICVAGVRVPAMVDMTRFLYPEGIDGSAIIWKI